MNDGVVVYNVQRSPDRRVFYMDVGYKGTSETDTGYFHCPYLPTLFGVNVTPELLAERWNHRQVIEVPTPIQRQIMDIVRESPMTIWKGTN